MQVIDGEFRFTQPATEQLSILWTASPPRTILLLKKLGPKLLPHVIAVARSLGRFGVTVLVERDVLRAMLAQPTKKVDGLKHVMAWDPAAHVDLVLTLGGDGVILHASSMFQGPVPPVVGEGGRGWGRGGGGGATRPALLHAREFSSHRGSAC